MNFRHSMTWLHTWSGLLLGWLLYFMFVTGTAGYFDVEITRWMQPEIPVQSASFDTNTLIPKADRRLQEIAPKADEYFIELPLGRYPYFMIWWHNPDTVEHSGWHNEILDPNTGEPVAARETAGGEFLYRLHYVLHYIPKGLAYWLTSLAAMFMLVAIISGVVVHRRIFKDFFTFRRTKKQTSWLDMHNLFGVLPLPFYLMITYSGLILLMFSTMLPIPASTFGLNPDKFKQIYNTVFTEAAHRDAAGSPAASIPLLSFHQQAQAENKHAVIVHIAVENPGDKNALVQIGTQAETGLDVADTTLYQATNGEVYTAADHYSDSSAAMAFYETMEKLHEGLFAGPVLRWLYFLSGLMGAAMVATGTIFWAIKRRTAHDKIGHKSRGLRLVEGLNVGIVVGLPIAIAAYFCANRLLPATLESRTDWETHSLFLIWFIAIIHPFIRRANVSLTGVWAEQLNVAALLFAAIPLLNMVTSDYHLIKALRHGDWVLVGFDLFMLFTAFCFGCAAYRVKNNNKAVEETVTKNPATEVRV